MPLQNFVAKRLPAISAAWLNLIDNLVIGTGLKAPNDRTPAEIAASVIPVNYAYPPGNPIRQGAPTDGITSAYAAFFAQNATGEQIHVTKGAYLLDSNLTISSTIIVDSGVTLVIPTGIILTITGEFSASRSSIVFVASGTGKVVIDKTTNPQLWANWFSGSDIGAKINAAFIAASSAGPVVIRVAPSSTIYANATKINLVNSESVRLCGPDTPVWTPNNRTPNIAWSGAAGSGPMIDASGSLGFELDHITITYTDAAYNGNPISLAVGAVEARLPYIHHCSITGTNTAKLATRLIELAGTLSAKIEKCYFRYAVSAIGCSAGSNNVIDIHDNWFDKEFSLSHIVMRGGSWTIEKNVFESDATAGITTTLLLAGETNGVSFKGNMCIDGGAGGGTMLNLSGSDLCTSVDISGNVLGAGSGTALLLSSTGGNSDCIHFHANQVTCTTGLNLAAGKNITISNNKFVCTTPWTGTSPQRLFIQNNDMNGVTTSGVSVANNGNYTLASTNAQGAGHIFVFSVEDSATAIFALNGGASTTVEISDPAGLFSITSGTASSINIFNSGGTSYVIENKRGGNRTLVVNSFMGV